jgi:hypothetical protein
LPIRNPIFFQFPRLPLYKRKAANSSKVTKKREQNKETHFFFLPRQSNFAIFLMAKLQKKPDIQIVSTLFFYPFPLFPPQTAYHLCHLQASGEAPIIETGV